MKNLFIISLIISATLNVIHAQSMLDEIDNEIPTEQALNAFKSTRVINSHSMEMLPYGALDFRILHRFDYLSTGVDNFFGLDNARTMRLGLDYGILDNLSVGIGRSTYKKEIDGFARYRLLWQSKGKKSIPVSVVYTVGFVYQSQKNNIFSDPDVTANFSRRLSYYHQVIIGRKFSERFTLQLSPILVHSNYVENALDPNNLFALGLGTRYKITKRFAVLIDYTYPFNSFPFRPLNHPLSIGVDIETGGHVFQLHFSNSPGVTERAYIRDQNGDWFNGNIGFGFNISRLFQITHHKIEGL